MKAEIDREEVLAQISALAAEWWSTVPGRCSSDNLRQLRSRLVDYLDPAASLVNAGEELERQLRLHAEREQCRT